MTEKTDSHACSSIENVRLIELDKHSHPKGKLSVVENTSDSNIPFAVRRVFYLYDVPADSERGGHSHFLGEELIVAVAGAFEVELDDGVKRKRWRLDRPFRGLYVPRGLWRVIDNFSGGAVCMVLTSTEFDEGDYVRQYEQFLTLTENKRK